MIMKTQVVVSSQIYGMPQKQRKIHSNAGLPQEKEEKSQIDSLTHHLNELEKKA